MVGACGGDGDDDDARLGVRADAGDVVWLCGTPLSRASLPSLARSLLRQGRQEANSMLIQLGRICIRRVVNAATAAAATSATANAVEAAATQSSIINSNRRESICCNVSREGRELRAINGRYHMLWLV